MAFDGELRRKLHGTKPLERPGKEIRRRGNVVGILPDREAVIRLPPRARHPASWPRGSAVSAYAAATAH